MTKTMKKAKIIPEPQGNPKKRAQRRQRNADGHKKAQKDTKGHREDTERVEKTTRKQKIRLYSPPL